MYTIQMLQQRWRSFMLGFFVQHIRFLPCVVESPGNLFQSPGNASHIMALLSARTPGGMPEARQPLRTGERIKPL